MRDPGKTGYAPNLVPGITAEERLPATSRNVACDGGSPALGHPLIWMRIEGEEITCPYCSRTFVLQAGVGEDNHH